MANHRIILPTALILLTITFTFATLYLTSTTHRIPIPTLPKMSPSPARTAEIPLTVIISPSPSPSPFPPNSLILLITLHNTSPSPLYILTWSSPHDRSLPALGLVKFTSLASNTPAACLDMKINRRVPPEGYFAVGDESIVRVEGKGKVERTVVFKEPQVALGRGEEYRVSGRGMWMGVWVGEVGEGREMERLVMSEEGGMRTGEWESNEIVVRVDGEREGELKD